MGKMLVIADIKETCAATSRGLQLAYKLGHTVEVVAFTHVPLSRLKVSAGEQKIMKQRLLALRETAVQARIDKFVEPGQKVTLKVVWEKDIHEWILKRCAKACDLVVKTGRRTESFTYTSTDWRLLRECPVPVLIVADKKWHRARPVLAAIDLGTSVPEKKRLNQQILAQAKSLSQVLDAELKLISAIEIPTLLADLDLIDPGSFVRDAKEAAKPAIAELAAAHDIPQSAFRLKRGPVEKVITSDAARQRAQLVVMGTVGRKGVKARLLGNTAEAVLRHLKTDVLALKLKD